MSTITPNKGSFTLTGHLPSVFIGNYVQPLSNTTQYTGNTPEVTLQIAPPITDENLDNIINRWLSNITGINSMYVIPMWQPVPPNMIDSGIDWLSFGIKSRKRIGTAEIQHNSLGIDELVRQEEIEIAVSIYGSNANYIELKISDGIYFEYNNYQLMPYNIRAVGVSDSITVPDLIKDIWVYRIDTNVTFRRQVKMSIPVPNIESINPDSTLITKNAEKCDCLPNC